MMTIAVNAGMFDRHEKPCRILVLNLLLIQVHITVLNLIIVPRTNKKIIDLKSASEAILAAYFHQRGLMHTYV